MNEWQEKAMAFLQSENPIGRLFRIEDRQLNTKLMTRHEIVCRRFEAIRMKWPDKAMESYTQQMLVLRAPAILRLVNRHN